MTTGNSNNCYKVCPKPLCSKSRNLRDFMNSGGALAVQAVLTSAFRGAWEAEKANQGNSGSQSLKLQPFLIL